MLKKLNLNDLLSGCKLYGEETDYDKSYIDFLNTINHSLDLRNRGHIKALYDWLKSWGCIHFMDNYCSKFSDDIYIWYKKYEKFLPYKDKKLLDFNSADYSAICLVYEFLSNIKVSHSKSLGPTCTAKTLFAFRPDFFIPWDNDIRKEFHCGNSAFHYIKYLNFIKDILYEIENQCKKNGFSLIELPVKIGRPFSTPTKLIDEYFWITITKDKTPQKINIFLV